MTLARCSMAMRGAFPRWLFAALLAAVLIGGLHLAPLSSARSGCVVELWVKASGNEEAHLIGDYEGKIRRDKGVDFSLRESTQPVAYRVPLPSGSVRQFLLMTNRGKVLLQLAGARLLDARGQVLATFAGEEKDPPEAMAKFSFDRILELPPDEDPSRLWALGQWMAATVLGALAGPWLARRLAHRQEGWRRRVAACGKWIASRPRIALFGTAVLATLLSCHPVIFSGRSFASPHNGAFCLYDQVPTIPGTDAQVAEVWNSSDVRALLWAHLPYSAMQQRAIFRDHELPLWNRWNLCGVTLLGQGQSMIGDPLHWLPILAGGAAWAWDLKFLFAKTLFAFGFGLLVWRTTRHLGVAQLLALSSAFLGFFSYRFTHPAFFSVCIAPWILFCWVGAAQAKTLRGAGAWALALVGANWWELNSGTAKEAAMILLGLNAAGVLVLWMSSGRPRVERLRRLLIMGGSGMLFLALSAPLLTVFFSSLQGAYTSYAQPAAYQLPPALLLGLFDDLFYREVNLGEWHVAPAANFFMLLGLLWLVADYRAIRRRDPICGAMAMIALALLCLIFGIIPPGWITALPLLKNIWHIDNTFTCVLLVPLGVLAGFGLRSCAESIFVRPHKWHLLWSRTLIVLALLAALYFGSVTAEVRAEGMALRLSRPFAPSPFFVGYVTVLLVAVATLPWWARLWRQSPVWAWPAALLAVAAFTALHFRQGMWGETKFDYYVMNPQERADLTARSPAVDYLLDRPEPGRVIGFGSVLSPGFQVLYGLESPTGADAVANRWYAEWLEAAGLPAGWMYESALTKESLVRWRPFLDALNVRYYLAPTSNREHPAPGLRQVAAGDLDIYESPTAWPRAFFTDRLSRYRDPRQLAAQTALGDGRPFAAALADEILAPSFSEDQITRQVVPARDYRLTANTTTCTFDASGPGVALLAEAAAPEGVRARVNGQPVKVFRLNHCFRGVSLPAAGTYIVEWEYWPQALTPALWVGGLGLVFILMIGIALIFVPRFASEG